MGFKHPIRNSPFGIRVVGPRGNLTISESNLMANSEFNILVFSTGNWWGMAEESRIEVAISHLADDDTLAEVVSDPSATARVPAAP